MTPLDEVRQQQVENEEYPCSHQGGQLREGGGEDEGGGTGRMQRKSEGGARESGMEGE